MNRRVKFKALSNEAASRIVKARQQDRAYTEAQQTHYTYKLMDSEVEYNGDGPVWDESQADRAAAGLRAKKCHLLERGRRLEANTFDRYACKILHETLELPPSLAASDGFWRWMAVEKFGDIIEARHGVVSRSNKPALPANYGIYTSATRNRLVILWFRAEMLYDSGNQDDPYHLATRPLHTDFLESGIIRHRYGWCRNLARALVRFQYPDAASGSVRLHSTHANGIRELYKRLRRLHSVISFEYLSDEEIVSLLDEKSSDLQRAQ